MGCPREARKLEGELGELRHVGLDLGSRTGATGAVWANQKEAQIRQDAWRQSIRRRGLTWTLLAHTTHPKGVRKSATCRWPDLGSTLAWAGRCGGFRCRSPPASYLARGSCYEDESGLLVRCQVASLRIVSLRGQQGASLRCIGCLQIHGRGQSPCTLRM